jgi:hypothetical protein
LQYKLFLVYVQEMVTGKLLRKVLDKFLKSPVVQEARVQICMPNGEMFDIKDIKLMENKLLGVRESHRLVMTVYKSKWNMGEVIKKID